jgi:hypothetical protein
MTPHFKVILYVLIAFSAFGLFWYGIDYFHWTEILAS